MLRTHKEEQQQGALHETDDTLEVVNTDDQPIELNWLRCGRSHKYQETDEQDACRSPFERNLGQILKSGERSKGCAEDLVENSNLEHVRHCRQNPIAGVIGP